MTPEGFGAVVSIPYGPVAEWLVDAGYRWIVIDAEHAPIGPREQVELVTAVQTAGAAAYVRVAGNDERSIGFALDAGADGVIVPDIRTVGGAERAARACRYPPGGVRSIGPIRRQPSTPVCIVQIESVAGVDADAAIGQVDGVDALMVGPGDLALNAGLVPGIDAAHPTMVDLCLRIRQGAQEAGVPAGTFALLGEDDVRRAADQGWDFVATCLDRLALTAQATRLVSTLTTSAGEER